MIRFVAPEAFLLVPLAALLLRHRLWPRPLLGVLRLLCLTLLAALLAWPYRPGAEDGRDVVVVFDRSRSMPAAALQQAQELTEKVREAMQPGDRLGLVAFGRKPTLELLPQAAFSWPDWQREVDVDGSDLAAAIEAGLAAIPPGRRGSLLVVSDGEANGGDLDAAARAAARQGVRIDTVLAPRGTGSDAAVVEIAAPAFVEVGQPFAVTAVVLSDVAGEATYRLLGEGRELRAGRVELVAGRNVLQFRRVLDAPGQHEVAFEVRRVGDGVPENDRGVAIVRGEAGRRVLCITPQGREDRLTRTLRAVGLQVVTSAAQTAPLTLEELDGIACVVLEDVPAADLPPGAMARLAHWVKNLGGGLLMTGGKASYGVGGYYQTPIEAVLPVTMELREEQRRFGLAMAIALDRSGSMQADAGGVTKMNLAARGAATAVELLSAIDSVSVIAVDSAAHLVVPLSSARDRAAIAAQTRRIESMGGGIFVGAALEACASQLQASTQQNRHIVLFADAADAEEPGEYRSFVPSLAAAGITVSVIGLGTPADSDAALLQEIAKLGNGRCHFVAEAADLPRVFAQETIQVARSALVEERTQVRAMAPLATLGDLPLSFPAIGGYSVAWRRERGELDLQAIDDLEAPILSHWQHGLGRAAALLAEVDGPLTGDLAEWDRLGTFLGTLVRWVGGGQTPGVFVEARRQGADGIFAVEVEEAQAALLDRVRGVLTLPGGAVEELPFERQSPTRLAARVPLTGAGAYRAALEVDGAAFRLPPLALPYSPELAPQPDPRGGERNLRRLALVTGGGVQPAAAEVVQGERESLGREEFATLCAALLLALIGLEIAARRFHWAVPMPGWLARRLAPAAPVAPAVELRDAPRPVVRPAAPVPATPEAVEPAPRAGVLDALDKAKRRTRPR